MPSLNPIAPASQPGQQSGPLPRRTIRQILLSYFYWTYSRGSFHYDVMVTLILLIIFVTPQIPGWSYGDKPTSLIGPTHPIQVIGNDGHGLRHRAGLGCDHSRRRIRQGRQTDPSQGH
jgi:hypothetical protein